MKTASTISFDGWVLHADVGELVKDGRKIRLQQRPLLVLDELLANPGALVTREQLIARLWPKGVVDFDTGLNTAVRKLRVALDDVGEVPRYIETLPRKGYRFIGTIDSCVDVAPEPEPKSVAVVPMTPPLAATQISIPAPMPAPASTREAPASGPPLLERRLVDRRTSESPPVSSNGSPRRRATYALALVAVLSIAGIAYFATRNAEIPSPGTRAAPAPAQRPAADDLKIALLPLTTGTSSEPDDLLVKIVSDVLRQRLSHLQKTTLVGATGWRRTTTEPSSPRQFGVTVQARFVIDGSVTRQSDQLRLALQLIDVASGASVWSFDESRAVGDIAGLVDVATRGAARHLRVRADPGTQPLAIRPINLEAYGTYVRAKELMETQQIGDGQTALELFRRATVLDPQFANAYLGLAQAITFSAGSGTLSVEEEDKRAIESLAASARAHALDPGLGEALIERARLTADSAEADKLYREGLRLSPNYGRGYQRYAEFLFDEYRRGEAREAIERAHALDPLEPRVMIRLAMFRYLIDGDADAHDRLVREALTINPQLVTGLHQLGLSLWVNGGDFAEAILVAEKATSIDPDYEEMLNMLALMYLDVGDPAAAASRLEQCRVITAAKSDLALYQRDPRRAAEAARATRPTDWITRWGAPQAWALRDEAIATGDFTLALELMSKRYELATPWGPPKTGGPQIQNRALGLVYAHTLALAGETARGRKLAQTILAQLDGESVGRAPFYMSRDRAAAFAILGDKDRTLQELENSLRIGHYSYWWYYGELDPLFADLHANPRFQALVKQTKEHRARQRALLDEMRRKGEVPKR